MINIKPSKLIDNTRAMGVERKKERNYLMLTKAQLLRRKRKRRNRNLIIFTSLILFMVLIIFYIIITIFHPGLKSTLRFPKTKSVEKPPITEMFLTPNDNSRPQTPLDEVNSIVIHYTGNPGTDALANRNYFENLKETKTTYASSHFVIGLDGEIIQCLPLNEISFASNNRNSDTISIECTHPDATGKFNKKTLDSLIALTAWLCGEFNLKKDDIIRHYDVTGKKCPLYFVEHQDEWEALKTDIMKYIDSNKME
ncbi:MAG: N-acetylmuramoyl-L-alanine amidase [Anaerocolumna sp.]|jgi:N-acetyl-anhydromuramyl-L-alanine amidase AmpD|nr:N-acetylmuramoyl-L-alanine amidase [Anaerocolumna sp.]